MKLAYNLDGRVVDFNKEKAIQQIRILFKLNSVILDLISK